MIVRNVESYSLPNNLLCPKRYRAFVTSKINPNSPFKQYMYNVNVYDLGNLMEIYKLVTFGTKYLDSVRCSLYIIKI